MAETYPPGVDTRKNSRDLNRDSNRAFLVCGNAPHVALFSRRLRVCAEHFAHLSRVVRVM